MISKKTNTRCEHAEAKQKSKFTFVFPRQVTNTDTLQMTTCKYKDTRSRQAFKHVLQHVMLDLIPVLVFLKPLFEMGLKVGYAGHSLITSAGPFQTLTLILTAPFVPMWWAYMAPQPPLLVAWCLCICQLSV